jgi:hypothetical protein
MDGGSACCKAATYRGEQTQRKNGHTSMTCRIWTHDSSVWAGEDILCLRPHSHYNHVAPELKSKIKIHKPSALMLQYASCPGFDAVCKLLFTLDNFKFGDEITCRRWVYTNFSALVIVIVPCEEFTVYLTYKIWTTLHPHSFVTQHWIQILTKCK